MTLNFKNQVDFINSRLQNSHMEQIFLKLFTSFTKSMLFHKILENNHCLRFYCVEYKLSIGCYIPLTYYFCIGFSPDIVHMMEL